MRAQARKITIAISVITILLLGLAASAAMDDNTVVNLGFDENSQFFLWNVTSLDYEPWLDAVAADDELGDADFETLLAMCGITAEGDDPATLDFTFDGATLSVFDSEGAPVDTGICGAFVGATVIGPAGQVNHGMFMKVFNSLYEGTHRGCVARVIAQSGLGKDDQQVRPEDVDDTAEAEGPQDGTVTGTATFETETTRCRVDKGNKEDKVDKEDKGGGPPEHVLEKFGGDHPKDRESKGKPAGTPGGRP